MHPDRLDYLYTPSEDVAADLTFLTGVLGGEAGFAIDDGGTKVAMVALGSGPPILLTDHLEGDRPIHVLAVADLDAAVTSLEAQGCAIERRLELPPGPAATFRSPSGFVSRSTNHRGRSWWSPSAAGATSELAPRILEPTRDRRARLMAVATPPFTGFSPAAIQFLADLKQNNDRAWFQPRKAEFEALLKEPMEAMIATLSERLAARGVPIVADSKRSPFRIYRDTRFSKDKSPYKTHLGATFPWAGDMAGVRAGGGHDERAHGNGGYFHFEPGEMYVGGGMWQMEKLSLEAFRTAVRDDPDQVLGAIGDPAFVASFGEVRPHDQLKRFPPGWPQDHPQAAMFLWKDVVFGRRLADAEVLSADLPDRLAEGYAAAVPVFRFLETLR